MAQSLKHYKGCKGARSANIIVALGSNRPGRGAPNPADQIIMALRLFADYGLELTRSSLLYRSRALGPRQRDYVNAVALARTHLSPLETLDALKKLEQALGRRREQRWGPRKLDLDLIDYAGLIWPNRLFCKTSHHQRLILPHPEIDRRCFVLRPLLKIAPDWQDARNKERLRLKVQRLRLPPIGNPLQGPLWLPPKAVPYGHNPGG